MASPCLECSTQKTVEAQNVAGTGGLWLPKARQGRRLADYLRTSIPTRRSTMTAASDVQDAAEVLRAHGIEVDPILVQQATAGVSPDPRVCARCGVTEEVSERSGGGGLTEITIVVAAGEEGHAEETRWVCDTHLLVLTDLLATYGFGSHRHGGINHLEDLDCEGAGDMSACPFNARNA
jgi:hypothetical protein